MLLTDASIGKPQKSYLLNGRAISAILPRPPPPELNDPAIKKNFFCGFPLSIISFFNFVAIIVFWLFSSYINDMWHYMIR